MGDGVRVVVGVIGAGAADEALYRAAYDVGAGLARAGFVEIDAAARTVHRDGEEVPLTYSEFEILHKLASSPRRVFTREELMNHLWKGPFFGDLRSVDVHVRHLRQKLERDPANPRYLVTVRGAGYMLVPD